MAEAAKKAGLETLKNVIFVYTSTTYKKKQLNKENKPPKSDSPDEFHSYEVKILLSRTRFKELKGRIGNAKNFPNAKELEPQDCVDQWNIELPEEEMMLIKFSQAVLTGSAIADVNIPGKTTRKPAKPISVIGVMGGVQDRNKKTIGMETNIGHGTKGHFQFNPVENEHGIYCYPVGICITELVEFLGGAGKMDESAFGIEELQEVDPDTINTEADENYDDEVPDL